MEVSNNTGSTTSDRKNQFVQVRASKLLRQAIERNRRSPTRSVMANSNSTGSSTNGVLCLRDSELKNGPRDVVKDYSYRKNRNVQVRACKLLRQAIERNRSSPNRNLLANSINPGDSNDIICLWDSGVENKYGEDFSYRKYHSVQVRAAKLLRKAIERRRRTANQDLLVNSNAIDLSESESDVEVIICSKVKIQKRDKTSFVKADNASNDCGKDANELVNTSAPRKKNLSQDAWLSNSWKGEGPPHFTCEVCLVKFDKKFVFTAHLFKHREQEARERNDTCTDCEIRFHNQDALHDHYDRCFHGCGKDVITETGEITFKKFSCPECPSMFSQKYYLMVHVKSHYRDNTCHQCQQVFPCEFDLKMHMSQVHGRK